jgi:hypothetical protein
VDYFADAVNRFCGSARSPVRHWASVKKYRSWLARNCVNLARRIYQLEELGRFYRGYERLMEHWRSVLPQGVMLDVDYEGRSIAVRSDGGDPTKRCLGPC